MWQAEFAEHLIPTFSVVFLASVAVCSAMLIFKKPLLRTISREDLASIQSMHTVPTPRLGGAAVVVGIIASMLITSWSPLERQGTMIYLVTLSPILIAGLLEDIGMRISPRSRLIASIMAGLMTSLAWGVSVQTIGVPLIDMALAFAPLAIALTVFGAAGVTNAFNLIDGLNGLAGFIALSTAFALAAIAQQFGIHNLQAVLWMLSAAVFGFLIFNFPFGKIFLGDGGAYTLGHTLVWSAIALTNLVPDISAFAILLIFFWPVADTLLSIWRRRTKGLKADQPDRLHFHQLVLRYIEIRFFGRQKRRIANPIATLVIMPFVVIPQIFGVLLVTNDVAAKVAVVIFALIFAGTYLFGVRHARRMSARLKPKDA